MASLTSADPDGDGVSSKEPAEAAAEPLQHRAEVHHLVELGHQVDQRTRLTVPPLPGHILPGQFPFVEGQRAPDSPEVAHRFLGPAITNSGCRFVLQSFGREVRQFREQLAYRARPAPGQKEASHDAQSQEA